MQDLTELRTAWDQVSRGERKELVKHFLADGIGTRAFVLESLGKWEDAHRLCLAKAGLESKVSPVVLGASQEESLRHRPDLAGGRF